MLKAPQALNMNVKHIDTYPYKLCPMCVYTHTHSSTRQLAIFEHQTKLQTKVLESGVHSTHHQQMAIMVAKLFSYWSFQL